MDGFGRSLRAREAKVYNDTKIDDVIEGKRQFCVEEKLVDKKFNENLHDVILEMDGQNFNLKYIQENGFNMPILFKRKDGLGLKMPDANLFSVIDVKSYVGARRVLDVFDCDTHESIQMSVHQWVKYYMGVEREKVLNVTSLEFSHTGLDRLVKCPDVVENDLDWVQMVWPKHLLSEQKDTTNVIENMKYPKVRKYCLMSVAGCYTDFHIDFGGTSVWYHILKGAKVFWLIPPTDENLKYYEYWVLSGRQQDMFLGDIVNQCHRVHLIEGDTFMIPTGWIHSVYTPVDSLVFGGNFIHSYNISLQLKAAKIEETTHVPRKLCFPFFAELHWYVIKAYVDILERDLDERRILEFEAEDEGFLKAVKDDALEDTIKVKQKWANVYLTNYELSGLKDLCNTFRTWNLAKFNFPSDLKEDGMYLIDRLEELLQHHEDDDQFLACQGVNIFKQLNDHVNPSEQETESPQNNISLENITPKKTTPKKILTEEIPLKPIFNEKFNKYLQKKNISLEGITKPSTRSKLKAEILSVPSKNKRKARIESEKLSAHAKKNKTVVRRVRCRSCDGCLQKNCDECRYCLDMIKNGGPGLLKQSCARRFCQNPKLPAYVECYICHNGHKEDERILMECSICSEIVHPECLKKSSPCKMSKKVNNCWECPKCCTDKKAEKFSPQKARGHMSDFKRKQMVFKQDLSNEPRPEENRHQPIKSLISNTKPLSNKQMINKVQNLKEILNKSKLCVDKKIVVDIKGKNGHNKEMVSKGNKNKVTCNDLDSNIELRKLKAPKHKSFDKVTENIRSTLTTHAPIMVVRPGPFTQLETCIMSDGEKHPLNRKLWVRVFVYLNKNDISNCMLVSKAWNQWCLDSCLWSEIDISNRNLSISMLCGIVRRQPSLLKLSSTNPTAKQLEWLLKRLPRLEGLNLSLSTAPAISALMRVDCSQLKYLNLSWSSAIYDKLMIQLLGPIKLYPVYCVERRLPRLSELILTGCDISDETTTYIFNNLKNLRRLDISYCLRVTVVGVEVLIKNEHVSKDVLQEVLCEGCSFSENLILFFRRFPQLP